MCPAPISSPASPGEAARRLQSVVRLGTVEQVNHAAALVRVRSGALLTDWRPWLASRAGQTRHWSPPTVGEQVLLLSPSGDPAQAIILAGIYSDASPAPDSAATHDRLIWPDGGALVYDHAAGAWSLTVPGSIHLHAPQIDLTGSVQITGPVAIDGPGVTHNGVNIGSTHIHGAVRGGPDTSGGPQ